MHCGGCVARVEKVLRSLPGVQEAQVTGAYVPTGVDVEALRQAITSAGYEPLGVQEEAGSAPQQAAKASELRALQRRFLVSLVLSLPVVVGSMGTMLPWLPQWLSH